MKYKACRLTEDKKERDPFQAPLKAGPMEVIALDGNGGSAPFKRGPLPLRGLPPAKGQVTADKLGS